MQGTFPRRYLPTAIISILCEKRPSTQYTLSRHLRRARQPLDHYSRHPLRGGGGQGCCYKLLFLLRRSTPTMPPLPFPLAPPRDSGWPAVPHLMGAGGGGPFLADESGWWVGDGRGLAWKHDSAPEKATRVRTHAKKKMDIAPACLLSPPPPPPPPPPPADKTSKMSPLTYAASPPLRPLMGEERERQQLRFSSSFSVLGYVGSWTGERNGRSPPPFGPT